MISLLDTPKAIQIKSFTKIFNTSDDVSKDAIFAALVYDIMNMEVFAYLIDWVSLRPEVSAQRFNNCPSYIFS